LISPRGFWGGVGSVEQMGRRGWPGMMRGIINERPESLIARGTARVADPKKKARMRKTITAGRPRVRMTPTKLLHAMI
jgi:hypothetical protein